MATPTSLESGPPAEEVEGDGEARSSISLQRRKTVRRWQPSSI